MTLSDKMIKISNSGLVLCALIPFFFACKDPNALGLELDDQNSKTEVKIVEFTLPSTTIYIDSLRTDLSSDLLFGSVYNDSIVGDLKARAYVEYFARGGTLPSDSIKKDTLEFTSAFLVLKYSKLTINDTSGNFANENFSVHLANDTLFSTVTYFANMHTPFDEANPIGTYTAPFVYRDDSVTRVNLNNDFGRTLFNRLDSAGRALSNNPSRDSITRRLTYYPSLVLEPALDYQHFLNLDLDADTVGIYVEMKSKQNAKSYQFKFDIAVDANTQTPIRKDFYTEIIRNRSTGKYNDLITDYSESEVNSGTVHLNSIAGLHPKFNLTEFVAFAKNSENIIINRAELSYSRDDNPLPPLYTPATQSVRYYFLKENGRINTTAAKGLSGHIYGLFSDNGRLANAPGEVGLLTTTYNKDNHSYSSPVTLFCQDLLDSQIAGEDAFTTSLVLWAPNSTIVGQTSIVKSSVKLKVYYTKLK